METKTEFPFSSRPFPSNRNSASLSPSLTPRFCFSQAFSSGAASPACQPGISLLLATSSARARVLQRLSLPCLGGKGDFQTLSKAKSLEYINAYLFSLKAWRLFCLPVPRARVCVFAVGVLAFCAARPRFENFWLYFLLRSWMRSGLCPVKSRGLESLVWLFITRADKLDNRVLYAWYCMAKC